MFRLILSYLGELKFSHVRPFKCVRQFFVAPLVIEKQANVLSEGGSCMSLCICMNFFTLLLIGDNKQAAKSNCGRIKWSAY